MDLEPINGCVVVEITGELTIIEMPDKQYATNTTGTVKAVAQDSLPDYYYLMDKVVYFEGFKDVEVPRDDIKYAFVKIEDLRGYVKTQQEN
jgi:hypothetical protein